MRGFRFTSALGSFGYTFEGRPAFSDAEVRIMAVSAKDVDDYWTGRPMRPSYNRRYITLRAQYPDCS
jgi:hypothetical protein